jgi:hypothetical protein
MYFADNFRQLSVEVLKPAKVVPLLNRLLFCSFFLPAGYTLIFLSLSMADGWKRTAKEQSRNSQRTAKEQPQRNRRKNKKQPGQVSQERRCVE